MAFLTGCIKATVKSEQSMACPRWLNGFMAAGFHSGLISLSELKLEYMKAHRNAYSERMTEAQEQQLQRRLAKLCQMN